MKKEDLIISKENSPLKYFSILGEQLNNSWIFIHKNVFKALKETDADCRKSYDLDGYILTWNDNEYNISKIEIFFDTIFSNTDYSIVSAINSESLNFETIVANPESIFFIKMEE